MNDNENKSILEPLYLKAKECNKTELSYFQVQKVAIKEKNQEMFLRSIVRLSQDIAYDLIYEDKKKEGNITQWVNKPENQKVLHYTAKAAEKMQDDYYRPELVKSAVFDINKEPFNKTTGAETQWRYEDPKKVFNELMEATNQEPRILLDKDKEDILNLYPKSMKKAAMKDLEGVRFQEDMVNATKNNDNQWSLNIKIKSKGNDLSP